MPEQELPTSSPTSGMETALSNAELLSSPSLFFGLLAGIIIGFAIAKVGAGKK